MASAQQGYQTEFVFPKDLGEEIKIRQIPAQKSQKKWPIPAIW